MTDTSRDGLVADGVTVRFGGLLAVDNMTLRAQLGRITGLIGPNGAGKTTTFNACTGLLKPTAGRVRLLGDDVTGAAPQERARRGLGRTFQRMELFDTLPVRSNVSMGREGGMAGNNPLRHFRSTRKESAELRAAADEAMALCGISDLADERPGELSTGQRRLVELARCVAGDFKVMLMDEPSSGLDKAETARFGEILRELVTLKDTAILIVEHDMSLVLGVCDYIYVLDFGKPVFEGDARAVATSEVVRAAYLGSEAAAADTALAEAERQHELDEAAL